MIEMGALVPEEAQQLPSWVRGQDVTVLPRSSWACGALALMGILFTFRGWVRNEQVDKAPGWEAGKSTQGSPVEMAFGGCRWWTPAGDDRVVFQFSTWG